MQPWGPGTNFDGHCSLFDGGMLLEEDYSAAPDYSAAAALYPESGQEDPGVPSAQEVPDAVLEFERQVQEAMEALLTCEGCHGLSKDVGI